jgi:hypothetical protein
MNSTELSELIFTLTQDGGIPDRLSCSNAPGDIHAIEAATS